MNVSRGGYVIINLEGYEFKYDIALGTYNSVDIPEDIQNLIKYAYEKGKPVCTTNLKVITEEPITKIYTALWGTVSYDQGVGAYKFSSLSYVESEGKLYY